MRGYTLVHKHVYRVYSAVLGSQFACTHNPTLACVPDMHTCIMHTSSVYTRALHGRFDTPILRAHAGLHASEMKNVLCRALAARVCCQV